MLYVCWMTTRDDNDSSSENTVTSEIPITDNSWITKINNKIRDVNDKLRGKNRNISENFDFDKDRVSNIEESGNSDTWLNFYKNDWKKYY